MTLRLTRCVSLFVVVRDKLMVYHFGFLKEMVVMLATPSQEDYIEAIWLLIENKGYARTIDIADHLGVNNPSVTKMVQKLHESGMVLYERYRGISMTAEGERLGKKLAERHQMLELFLQSIGVQDRQEIVQTVEGIEHHFSHSSLKQIESLVQFIQLNPDWWEKFSSRSPE